MSDLKLGEFFFDENSIIKEQANDLNLSSLTGGKQLRSRLVELVASAHGVPSEDALQLGRIVEMVHNATLTHDDVIDNSHTRRGAPSIPAQINNKKSVLLGDYMLAKSLHELSDFNNPTLTKELTLTLKDLVEGEWIQFENTNPFEIQTQTYETLARKKTGSLFRWCFLAPLVVNKYEQSLYDLYAEFGEQLGVLFQMTDDLIDFNEESKKTYGLDLANNNINYVLHFVGIHYPELKRDFLQADNIASLNLNEEDALKDCLEIAKNEMSKRFECCNDILGKIRNETAGSSEYHEELGSILELLKTRTF